MYLLYILSPGAKSWLNLFISWFSNTLIIISEPNSFYGIRILWCWLPSASFRITPTQAVKNVGKTCLKTDQIWCNTRQNRLYLSQTTGRFDPMKIGKLAPVTELQTSKTQTKWNKNMKKLKLTLIRVSFGSYKRKWAVVLIHPVRSHP